MVEDVAPIIVPRQRLGVDRGELKIIGNADQCESAARFYDRLGFSVVHCDQRHDRIVEAAMGLDLHR